MILDYMVNLVNYASLLPKFDTYVDLLTKLSDLELGSYQINETDVINIMEGTTLPMSEGQFEYHHDYLDIQIILSGEEYVQWENVNKLKAVGTYDPDKDIGFLGGEGQTFHIKKGMCYIVFPEDAHMPGRYLTIPNTYKKAVVKVKIN